jgi:hypothetical protein
VTAPRSAAQHSTARRDSRHRGSEAFASSHALAPQRLGRRRRPRLSLIATAVRLVLPIGMRATAGLDRWGDVLAAADGHDKPRPYSWRCYGREVLSAGPRPEEAEEALDDAAARTAARGASKRAEERTQRCTQLCVRSGPGHSCRHMPLRRHCRTSVRAPVESGTCASIRVAQAG